MRELLDARRPSWMRDAACQKHPERDYFSRNPAEHARCIAICRRCAVREECRQFADATDDRFAVLGGEDPATRKARWKVRGRLGQGGGVCT